jgi:hypothetical protein
MSSATEVVGIRIKVLDGKLSAKEIAEPTKAIGKLGKETSKTSKITHAASGTTSRLTGAYKKLGTNAKWALGLVGAGAVFGIESAISSTEELSKTTTNLSRNLGFTTRSASEWGAVAQAREISTSALSTSFGTLSSKMVEAGRKGGSLLTPFHQLGISQEEVEEGAHNFQGGLLRVAQALGEEEGGTKRNAAAKALLGRGYKELLPMFSKGSKGLQEQLHWADEFGVTLSGKTNKGLEDMIEAQRKNKVAMLGLKVSMTTALMPAISAGDEQLQEFISTLNSPHLTAEEKITRIGQQFNGIETDLIKVIERALPEVASQAGRLGIVAAGSLAKGFVHSNVIGKVAIAGYVFDLLGGKSLALSGAKSVGGLIGTEMGIGLATGAVGAFAVYEVWQHLSERSKLGIEMWVSNAGETFVNGLISEINHGIRDIDKAFNDANVFSILGVSAPQIGEIGGVEFGGKYREQQNHLNFTEGLIEGPGGKVIKPKTQAQLEAGRHRKRPKAAAQMQTIPGNRFGGEKIVNHQPVQLVIDGKKVSEIVLKHAQNRSSLK